MRRTQVGPFTLRARIGRGATSETYVAERRGVAGFTFLVCLKIAIFPSDDPKGARLFHEEAKLASDLKHPDIVAVYEIGEDDGYWWMAMELVDGVDLALALRVLRARGELLPLDAALFVTLRVADALDHAHAFKLAAGTPAGIVHRDVKPSNVLLSQDGIVKLTDFGIAKYVETERTATGLIKGTIPYMSPEQTAQVRDIDGRSDLFSLGVMLFEMIAGKRPFDGASQTVTLANIGRCRFTADLPSSAPTLVKEVVVALLQQQRDRRPRTGMEVVEALTPIAPSSLARRTIGRLVASVRAAGPLPPETEITEARDETVVDPTMREKR